MADPKPKKAPRIAYSCYYSKKSEGEQFVSEHVFSYQISGTLTVNNGQAEYVVRAGDFRFIRRNQLVKFTKQPSADGVFKSISIYLDQETLKSFSREFAVENPSVSDDTPQVVLLKEKLLFKSFMDSLSPYISPDAMIPDSLAVLKQREAVLILLQANPELKSVLFDFTTPEKIDLESFMLRNFKFNVHLNRFAYLTGRSLATFKRDFRHIFKTSPNKWLQQKRLQEAHYLIKNKQMTAGEVYLEVGFENLSHFSFAFKKEFGVPPSKLT